MISLINFLVDPHRSIKKMVVMVVSEGEGLIARFYIAVFLHPESAKNWVNFH